MSRATTKGELTPSVRRNAQLTWADLVRWFTWREVYGDDRKKARGVDPRLFTVPPAISGLLEGLYNRDRLTSKQRLDLLKLAKPTLWPDVHTAFRRDTRRAHVECDWALRCALPIWLDRLPAWCAARAAAKDLRQLTPLLWLRQQVDGLTALTPIWASLQDAARDEGTANERQAVGVAYQKATISMRLVADTVVASLQLYVDVGKDEWRAERAMDLVLDGEEQEWDDAVARSLPALVGVLAAVHPDDSQQSIASRCTWTKPSKSAAA